MDLCGLSSAVRFAAAAAPTGTNRVGRGRGGRHAVVTAVVVDADLGGVLVAAIDARADVAAVAAARRDGRYARTVVGRIRRASEPVVGGGEGARRARPDLVPIVRL